MAFDDDRQQNKKARRHGRGWCALEFIVKRPRLERRVRITIRSKTRGNNSYAIAVLGMHAAA